MIRTHKPRSSIPSSKQRTISKTPAFPTANASLQGAANTTAARAGLGYKPEDYSIFSEDSVDLHVRPSDDKYEQQANRLNAKIMQRMHARGIANPRSEQVTPLTANSVSTEPTPGSDPPYAVSGPLAGETRRIRSGGSALPPRLRQSAEQVLGVSLGSVRVHSDGVARRLCRHLHANAFTVGQDIFLPTMPSATSPNTPSSMAVPHLLLGEEVVHAVQQTKGRFANNRAIVQRNGDDAEELKAKIKKMEILVQAVRNTPRLRETTDTQKAYWRKSVKSDLSDDAEPEWDKDLMQDYLWARVIDNIKDPKERRRRNREKKAQSESESLLYDLKSGEISRRTAKAVGDLEPSYEHTLKESTSLLPPHGRMQLYNETSTNPATGLLFDTEQSDMKDWRYTFEQDAATYNKWWSGPAKRPFCNDPKEALRNEVGEKQSRTAPDELKKKLGRSADANEVPVYNEVLAGVSKKGISGVFFQSQHTEKGYADLARLQGISRRQLVRRELGVDAPLLHIPGKDIPGRQEGDKEIQGVSLKEQLAFLESLLADSGRMDKLIDARLPQSLLGRKPDDKKDKQSDPRQEGYREQVERLRDALKAEIAKIEGRDRK